MSIPQGTKFHGVAPSVDTANKGSATANARRDAYTIDQMVDYIGSRGLFTQIAHSTPVTDSTLDITAQWGAADASNSIDTHVLTLQRVF